MSGRKPKLYNGDGIKISIEQIRPGVRFDTQYESGCVVADDPSIYTYAGDKGFSFDAIDSDGVLCSFGSSMISRIDTQAACDTITKASIPFADHDHSGPGSCPVCIGQITAIAGACDTITKAAQ